MAKRKVILAVAGSGKTYSICHNIDFNKRNLILAYTNENICNIQKELCDAFGSIPKLTTVSTFDSFIYRSLILPYEPTIGEHFHKPSFESRGICMKNPPSMGIKGNNGEYRSNPDYFKKIYLEHYITQRYQYYCANLSELILQVKDKQKSLVKRGSSRLKLFYDTIWVDEFQDFREHDYELLVSLAKKLDDVVLVGDYYQHSVSATNNTGKPFKHRKIGVGFDKFVEELENNGFYVDRVSLNKSRRCSTNVCEYVHRKLGIDITSCGKNEGSVIWVNKNNASEILENDKIIKLVYENANKYKFHAMNWSYSKGDTVDAACVILIKKFESLDEDGFSTDKISTTSNKLYVAMTRSKGDLYLMKDSLFQLFKNKYTKV